MNLFVIPSPPDAKPGNIVMFTQADIDAGVQAARQVAWQHPGPVRIFERRNGGRFREVTLIAGQTAYTVFQLRVGDVHTILMYDANQNPNPDLSETEPAPAARTSILCLRDRKTTLITDSSTGAGGTFADLTVVTASKLTKALFLVGRSAPRPHVIFDQLEVLGDPEFTGDSPVPKVQHDNRLEGRPDGLFPGHLHTAMMVVMDVDGNFDWVLRAFETKKRLVTGQIDEIHVLDPGDPTEGEAAFYVTVVELGRSGGRETHNFSLGGGYGKDVRKDQRIPTPSWSFVIGPQQINPELNQHVVVRTHGVEYDGIFERDEIARSFGDIPHLEFPIGGGEVVTNKKDTVRADNVTGGDSPFEFEISYTYSVNYV
jgi:hypothetical protein